MYDKNFRVVALRQAARQHKIVNYSRFNKEQLIARLNAIAAVDKPIAPAPVETVGEKLVKITEGNCTCSYAVEMEDGTVRWNRTDVCHARLASLDNKPKFAWLNINMHHKFHLNPALYKKWVVWMLNKGPFAFLFDTKDFDEALKGSVRVSAEHGENQVFTAAVALREGSEFAFKLSLWDELVKSGVQENIAWIVAQNFTKSRQMKLMVASHTIYSLNRFPQETFKKFFKEGVWAIPGKPYKLNPGALKCHEALSGHGLYCGQEPVNPMSDLFSKWFDEPKERRWGEVSKERTLYELLKGTAQLEEFLK